MDNIFQSGEKNQRDCKNQDKAIEKENTIQRHLTKGLHMEFPNILICTIHNKLKFAISSK